MKLSANHYLQRAQTHAWEDGVTEILIGIGAMLYALFQHLYMSSISTSQSSTARIVLSVIASSLVVFAGIVIFRKIAERIKAQTTYPRTGYVELKRPPVEWSPRTVIRVLLIAPLASIVGVALMLGLLLLFAIANVDASLFLLSALLASSPAAIGWQTKSPRFYVLAGAILLVGLGLTVANTSGLWSLTLLFGLSGLLVSLSGGIALAHYLHAHPKNEARS